MGRDDARGDGCGCESLASDAGAEEDCRALSDSRVGCLWATLLWSFLPLPSGCPFASAPPGLVSGVLGGAVGAAAADCAGRCSARAAAAFSVRLSLPSAGWDESD